MKSKIAFFLFAACTFVFCDVHPIVELYSSSVSDPIEGFNRGVESFNAGAIKYVAYPLGEIYTYIAPKVVRDGISNVGNNLRYPISLVNNCLQGKWGNAWHETCRFGINTTAGVLGFWDRAQGWGYDRRYEDFGQTFGHYGFGPVFYLNLPFLGPSSGRDTLGMVCDFPFNITTWIFGGAGTAVSFGFTTNDVLSHARVMNNYFDNRYDTYALTRSAFIVLRQGQVNDFSFRHLTEAGELEESFGYVNLKTRNFNFIRKRRTGMVTMPGTKHNLKYTFWKRADSTEGTIYLLPGIGSHRESDAMASLAEMLLEKGWNVVVLSNTFAPDYFLQVCEDALPGAPSKDSIVLDKILALVRDDFASRQPRISDESSRRNVLMGLSLGAMNTLRLAALEKRGVASCPFDKYVAVNPPFDPMFALSRIDEYFDLPLGWPAETRSERVVECIQKVMLLSRGGEEAMSSGRIPLSLEESRFLIGLNIRLTLADALLAMRGELELPVLTSHPKMADLKVLRREALGISFGDYAKELVLPGSGAKDMDSLSASERLDSIGEELKTSSKVFLFHNRNDFLLKPEHLSWFESTFGDRATIFPRGGHLGNLHLPQVRETLLNRLADK